MIGVSLPLALFEDGAKEKRKPLLDYLKKEGVESVELRTVRRNSDAAQVRRAMELLWEEGFQVTVHGEVKSVESCVSDVF